MGEMSTAGRRVAVPEQGEEDEEPQEAWTALEQPGDYCGPVDAGDGKPRVYFLLPLDRHGRGDPKWSGVHSVTSPPHGFREADDGSLEIEGSIKTFLKNRKVGWHGHLDEGNVWREVF